MYPAPGVERRVSVGVSVYTLGVQETLHFQHNLLFQVLIPWGWRTHRPPPPGPHLGVWGNLLLCWWGKAKSSSSASLLAPSSWPRHFRSCQPFLFLPLQTFLGFPRLWLYMNKRQKGSLAFCVTHFPQIMKSKAGWLSGKGERKDLDSCQNSANASAPLELKGGLCRVRALGGVCFKAGSGLLRGTWTTTG